MGVRKDGRARGRHARGEGAPARKVPSSLACLPLACPFFLVQNLPVREEGISGSVGGRVTSAGSP